MAEPPGQTLPCAASRVQGSKLSPAERQRLSHRQAAAPGVQWQQPQRARRRAVGAATPAVPRPEGGDAVLPRCRPAPCLRRHAALAGAGAGCRALCGCAGGVDRDKLRDISERKREQRREGAQAQTSRRPHDSDRPARHAHPLFLSPVPCLAGCAASAAGSWGQPALLRSLQQTARSWQGPQLGVLPQGRQGRGRSLAAAGRLPHAQGVRVGVHALPQAWACLGSSYRTMPRRFLGCLELCDAGARSARGPGSSAAGT